MGSLRHTAMLATSIAVTLLAGPAGVAAAGPAPGTERMPAAAVSVARPPASAEEAALAAAKATGVRVEVTERRTETTEVYANPSGTFTADVHARPVRVKRFDGSWAQVDMTLRRSGAGGVVPTASPTPVRLSGGGDGPLVTIFRQGASLSLSWPSRLPAPRLSGQTATYPEVMPGVDLVVRAYEDGFAKAVVVKTPAAARNPALATIRFRTALSGLALRTRGDGSFVAVDDSSRELFAGSSPTMWDSGGLLDGAVDTPDEQRDRIAGPASGARRAPVPVRFDDGVFELRPDRAMLTDPATTFPVYIDPSVTVDMSYWTMINSRFPDQSYWSYDRSSGAKVGYVEDYSHGWVRYRSLFRFSTSSFAGKHVIGAQFSATLYHSYFCTKSRADLYQVVTGFHSGTDWNNSTPWASQYYLANASGQSCSSTGDVRMEWGSSALTSLTDGATGDWLVLGLRAYDESTINAGWKKFKSSTAKLSVTYNTPPQAPSDLTINGYGCVQGANRPVISSTSPKLTAYLYDADDADRLDVRIYWALLGSPTSFDNSILRQGLANRATMVINEGTSFPAGALEHGKTYYIRGYARDTSPAADRSPDSATCEFTIDTSRPENMPLITSTDYPADGLVHNGVGRTGSFTFDPNGVPDVVSYEYWLDGQPMAAVQADSLGRATVKLTPATRGVNTLYVRSKDAAGNFSDTRQDYTFQVGSATGPKAHWTMSEESGPTLVDGSGNGIDATLNGGTSRTAGRVGAGRDRALGLDGATGYAATPGPVFDTARSFAVAAWVRLADTTRGRTAVSVDGERSSAFRLTYDASLNRWAFVMTEPGDVTRTAASAAAPRPGVWTHLAGTFDEASGTLSLYVNGKLESTASLAGSVTATGPTAIGRGRSLSAGAEFFAGDVDDVRLWDRMAYAAEFGQIAKEVTLVGQWLFDGDASPAVADDASGYAHPATLIGAIARGPGRDGTDGLVGSGGWAATGGPVLLTDQSLTISAWVRLTDTANWRTAVSQAGIHCSGFLLQYDYASKKWAFSTGSADVDGATPVRAKSTVAPVTGQWTHLVGVYDASDRQLRIYVNGQPQPEGTVSFAAWHATGAFQIGVSLWDTGRSDAWRGDLDDVWAFTGVLTDAQIQDLYTNY